MGTPKRPIRNMRDIRTHAGIVDKTFLPYKAFMRITSLEMEKARREREKEAASARIESIEARFREIESEKADLLRALQKKDCIPSSGSAARAEPKLEEGTRFTLRY